jgi:hypothetical protein
LTNTDEYPILLSITYRSVSPEALMTNVTASPRRPVTSIGKREAQAWLLKQLGYERVLARLRAAHAAEKTGERERGVAA